MFTIPHPDKRLRWLIILTGITLFLWLSREDNSVRSVTVFGFVVALLALSVWITGKFGGHIVRPSLLIPFAALTGAAFGLSTALTTVALMLGKSVIHSHFRPDYPPELMTAILERIPAWSAAGALTALAFALLWTAFHAPEPDTSA